MRAAFVKTLIALAEKDRRIVLLTGDLGFMALEPFAERFQDRFFNVGVAEQNMVGLATGLAEAGFIPFVYSIVTFATLRPYEFIRNGPVLHNLPVRIVGVGGGFDYGHAGPTHHGLEDIGVMRIQPGLVVIAPADCTQVEGALLSTWNLPQPVYYRLGKNDDLLVPGLNGRFEFCRVEIIKGGNDALFITTGSIAVEVASAAQQLSQQGIACTVAVVSTLNPPPGDELIALLKRFPQAITVEAHYVTGGLGSIISEIIAEHGLACRVVRCGVTHPPVGTGGDQAYLYGQYGLSSDALVRIVSQHAPQRVAKAASGV